jgi:hypothetical protein
MHLLLTTIFFCPISLPLTLSQDKYLEELEVERSKYREEVVKERSTVKGVLWGTSQHELNERELAEVEAEVALEFPDEMDEPHNYADLYLGVYLTLAKWGGKVYRVGWRAFLQGDVELDIEHRKHMQAQTAAGAAVDDEYDEEEKKRQQQLGSSSSSFSSSKGSFKSNRKASSKAVQKRLEKKSSSIADPTPLANGKGDGNNNGSFKKDGSFKNTTPQSPLRTPRDTAPGSASSFMMGHHGGSSAKFITSALSHLSMHSMSSVHLDDDQGGGGGDTENSNTSGPLSRSVVEEELGEIMGFPKDCGPREGVHILSFKRAMHVKAMNHPHITFERKGHGLDAWRCTSEGFYSVKITDCVDEKRLPTPESEAKAYRSSFKKRERALKRMKLEKAEIASRLRAEFPPVQPKTAVRYVVSFPLDYDFGMHGCTDHPDCCGVGEVQHLLGCIDTNPLEEPLAQYGTGIMLYFKFFKFMIKIFIAYAALACVNVYVNYSGTGYSVEQRATMLEQGGLAAGVFFTTLGSWGEKTVQCRQEDEGTSFSLQCGGSAVFTSLEAFYGQPTGSCSCPSEQQLVGAAGQVPECPGVPDYSTKSYGECEALEIGDTHNGKIVTQANATEYCLQGFTPYGAKCCAGKAGPGPQHLPDFRLGRTDVCRVVVVVVAAAAAVAAAATRILRLLCVCGYVCCMFVLLCCG